MFGDTIKDWHGPVTFKTVAATNPKTKEEIEVLRVVVPKK
jgi:hypothetical protein